MKTIMFVTVLMSTVAVGAFFAAASHAEDDDGGSVACLNGPAGVQVKGNGNTADGVVYDATKGKSAAKPASNCMNSAAMGENEDDDGDED